MGTSAGRSAADGHEVDRPVAAGYQALPAGIGSTVDYVTCGRTDPL